MASPLPPTPPSLALATPPTHEQRYAIHSQNKKELRKHYDYLWNLPQRRAGRVSVWTVSPEGTQPLDALVHFEKAAFERNWSLFQRLRGEARYETQFIIGGDEASILAAEDNMARHLKGAKLFILPGYGPLGSTAPQALPPLGAPPGTEERPGPVPPVDVDF